MSSLTLVPFEAEHFRKVCDPSMLLMPELEGGLALCSRPGYAFSAKKDGKILGCGGIKEFWPGVGEAWAVYAVDRVEYTHRIARITRRILARVINEKHMRRVQAVVNANFATGMQFMRWLGFRLEGRMFQYGPNGDDYFLYAWTG